MAARLSRSGEKAMKLGECNWWPTSWKDKNDQDVPRQQITQHGMLENCELTAHGLMIEVEYHGRAVFGRVPWSSLNSPGNLSGLRDFLLDYTGELMDTVENLDFQTDQFNR